VLLLVREPADGHRLSPATGQFVVLRIQPMQDEPPLLPNDSPSGTSHAEQNRVSIKHEVNEHVQHLPAYPDPAWRCPGCSGAPRQLHSLARLRHPNLDRAGVGQPVLAMLHCLVAESPQRQVWWLCGACNPANILWAGVTQATRKTATQLKSNDLRQTAPNGWSRFGLQRSRPIDVALLEKPGVRGDFTCAAQSHFCAI
jgi:hypothetical protein